MQFMKAEMYCLVQNICVFLILLDFCVGLELFDERAWTDKRHKDNFFDYKESRDTAEEAKDKIKSFSNNIDFELFDQKSGFKQSNKKHSHHDEHIGLFDNQNRHLSPNVLELFIGTIKNVIGSQQQNRHVQHHHTKNETNKGIDIVLDSNTHMIPAIGNKQDLKFIFLGTKWCGSGDNAKDVNDIGYFYLTDHCCREHDLCEDVIEPNGERFGLKNLGKFTRLHCDCDEKFYKCLKRVNTLVSTQIGIFYFNILGHQCFKEEYPVMSCTSKMKGRCVDFKMNLSNKKSYQWFDNKWF